MCKRHPQRGSALTNVLANGFIDRKLSPETDPAVVVWTPVAGAESPAIAGRLTPAFLAFASELLSLSSLAFASRSYPLALASALALAWASVLVLELELGRRWLTLPSLS